MAGMKQAFTRLATMAAATMMALAVSAIGYQDTVAQVIGRVN